MNKEKQLSLCVITKNDEEFLFDCLNEMKDVADEMLVADLGSTDRTIELAKQAGAAVYQPEWKNDFSAVKNFCMELATGKWALFLQADEKIDRDKFQELRSLLKNPNAEGYVIYAGYDPKERNITSHTQFLRLIRNRKEYRFCYRSFEMIPDEVISSIYDSHILITHRGRKTVGWQLEERRQLLKEDLKENPQNSYIQYLEGIEFLNEEKCEGCAASMEQARQKLDGGHFYGPQLYKCLVVSLLYLEHYEEAEAALRESLQLFPFYSDLLVLRAELYLRLGQKEKALENLELCMHLREGLNVSVPGPEIGISVIEEMINETKN